MLEINRLALPGDSKECISRVIEDNQSKDVKSRLICRYRVKSPGKISLAPFYTILRYWVCRDSLLVSLIFERTKPICKIYFDLIKEDEGSFDCLACQVRSVDLCTASFRKVAAKLHQCLFKQRICLLELLRTS